MSSESSVTSCQLQACQARHNVGQVQIQTLNIESQLMDSRMVSINNTLNMVPGRVMLARTFAAIHLPASNRPWCFQVQGRDPLLCTLSDLAQAVRQSWLTVCSMNDYMKGWVFFSAFFLQVWDGSQGPRTHTCKCSTSELDP